MKAKAIRERVEDILRRGEEWGRSELAAELKGEVSDATLKRVLHEMVSEGIAESSGRGRSTRYRSSMVHLLLGEVDVNAHLPKEIDGGASRGGLGAGRRGGVTM